MRNGCLTGIRAASRAQRGGRTAVLMCGFGWRAAGRALMAAGAAFGRLFWQALHVGEVDSLSLRARQRNPSWHSHERRSPAARRIHVLPQRLCALPKAHTALPEPLCAANAFESRGSAIVRGKLRPPSEGPWSPCRHGHARGAYVLTCKSSSAHQELYQPRRAPTSASTLGAP